MPIIQHARPILEVRCMKHWRRQPTSAAFQVAVRGLLARTLRVPLLQPLLRRTAFTKCMPVIIRYCTASAHCSYALSERAQATHSNPAATNCKQPPNCHVCGQPTLDYTRWAHTCFTADMTCQVACSRAVWVCLFQFEPFRAVTEHCCTWHVSTGAP